MVFRMDRRNQVAAQLRALMDRHKISPADIERMTAVGERPPVSAVTVRRILKAEARTEPEPGTLRRIADAVNERYTVVFTETEAIEETAVDVSHRAGRFHLRFLGAPPPDGLEAELREVLDRWEKKAPPKGIRKA